MNLKFCIDPHITNTYISIYGVVCILWRPELRNELKILRISFLSFGLNKLNCNHDKQSHDSGLQLHQSVSSCFSQAGHECVRIKWAVFNMTSHKYVQAQWHILQMKSNLYNTEEVGQASWATQQHSCSCMMQEGQLAKIADSVIHSLLQISLQRYKKKNYTYMGRVLDHKIPGSVKSERGARPPKSRLLKDFYSVPQGISSSKLSVRLLLYLISPLGHGYTWVLHLCIPLYIFLFQLSFQTQSPD